MYTENKNIVRRLYDEVWNKRKLDLVGELISSSHALLDPFVSGSQVGPELYRRRVLELTASFPDLRFTLDDLIAEKDKVVASWVISATHKGDFMNIPATGKRVSVEGITIHYIRNGKILDSNARWDAVGLLRQLGAFPPLGRSKEAASRG
ncbi:MAG: ester cyclase [Candidatus Acidiferrales bacterium]